MPVLGAWMFNSIYKFAAYHFTVRTLLTNKTWVDAYRGAGRPEATFAIERMMDEPRSRASAATRSRSASRTGLRTTSSPSPRSPA